MQSKEENSRKAETSEIGQKGEEKALPSQTLSRQEA